MVLTACFTSYMLRVNISINIIAMVEKTNTESKNRTTVCPNFEGGTPGNHTGENLEKLTSVRDVSTFTNFPSSSHYILNQSNLFANLNVGASRSTLYLQVLPLHVHVCACVVFAQGVYFHGLLVHVQRSTSQNNQSPGN